MTTTALLAEKMCRNCKVTKDISEFHPCRRNLDGLQSWCRECLNESKRRYAQANRDEVRRQCNAWRARNLDKARARESEYRTSPRGRIVARATQQRRRARFTDTPADQMLTSKQWALVVKQSKGRCYWCGCKCKPTMDHVIPISKGGLHVAANIVVSCFACNRKKSNKIWTLL